MKNFNRAFHSNYISKSGVTYDVRGTITGVADSGPETTNLPHDMIEVSYMKVKIGSASQGSPNYHTVYYDLHDACWKSDPAIRQRPEPDTDDFLIWLKDCILNEYENVEDTSNVSQ